jgi:predicted  nucleic acid-binding Zn-ribbon protein
VSIREQIPFLENLSDLDERIRKLDEDLALRKGGLEAVRGEIATLEKRIGETNESLKTMDKTRNELLIEVRQMTQQTERSREKLGRSRNERETVAAQRELEELKKLIRDRDDEAEKIGNLAERARTSATELDARRQELTNELEGTAEGAMQALTDREKERVELASEREIAVKKLPPLLYRKYEAIRARRPRAIAKTHDGTCNGCHIAVPPMMFQKMMRLDEFEQCPNCKRILYYAPKVAADASSGPDGSSAP